MNLAGLPQDTTPNGLHPIVAERVEKIIQIVKEAHCIELKTASTYRSIEEQNQLFAQGRTRRGKKVTNARGGESFHNYGLAADLCLFEPVLEKGKRTWFPNVHPVWNHIGQAANVVGLEWGGDWKRMKDRPHVQAPIPLDIIKTAFRKGGMNEVWRVVTEYFTKEKQ